MAHLPEIWSVVNFLILLGVLLYVSRKPFSKFLVERSDEWRSHIEDAARLHDDAQTMLKEYESKVQALDSQIEQILDEAKKSGAAEKERIIEQAKKSAEKMIADAQLQAENMTEQERFRLQKETLLAAIEQAKADLGKQMDKQSHQSWVDYFVEEVERERVQ